MTGEKIIVTTDAGMIGLMPAHKTPLRELLDWLNDEKGLSLRELARRSGKKFGHNTLSTQADKEEPNLELDTIRGLAKASGLSQHLILDVCNGKRFKESSQFSGESVKELLQQYEALKPANRTDIIRFTLSTLQDLVGKALKEQEEQNTTRR